MGGAHLDRILCLFFAGVKIEPFADYGSGTSLAIAHLPLQPPFCSATAVSSNMMNTFSHVCDPCLLNEMNRQRAITAFYLKKDENYRNNISILLLLLCLYLNNPGILISVDHQTLF